jgi:hypothetical protein
MLLFFHVFACHSATIHAEAILATGSLAYAAGSDFVKYMPLSFSGTLKQACRIMKNTKYAPSL